MRLSFGQAEKEEKSEKRAEKRAEEAAKVEQLIKQRKEESSITLEAPDVDYATLEEDIEDEEEYIGETEKVTRQTRINIEPFVAENIRAKNSPGSAAAIWNTVIKCS